MARWLDQPSWELSAAWLAAGTERDRRQVERAVGGACEEQVGRVGQASGRRAEFRLEHLAGRRRQGSPSLDAEQPADCATATRAAASAVVDGLFLDSNICVSPRFRPRVTSRVPLVCQKPTLAR